MCWTRLEFTHDMVEKWLREFIKISFDAAKMICVCDFAVLFRTLCCGSRKSADTDDKTFQGLILNYCRFPATLALLETWAVIEKANRCSWPHGIFTQTFSLKIPINWYRKAYKVSSTSPTHLRLMIQISATFSLSFFWRNDSAHPLKRPRFVLLFIYILCQN